MTKKIELIKIKEFATAAIVKNADILKIYSAAWLKPSIYPSREA